MKKSKVAMNTGVRTTGRVPVQGVETCVSRGAVVLIGADWAALSVVTYALLIDQILHASHVGATPLGHAYVSDKGGASYVSGNR